MRAVLPVVITPTARTAAAVLGLLLLLSACAQRPGGGGGAAPGPAAPLPDDPGALVLQVSSVGGFLTPELIAGRLPLVSIYRDGRVLTEGPVAAIYPGFAWPNVQLQRIDPADVQELADRAVADGVGDTFDLGRPSVTDVPTTRFTLVTGDGRFVREAYALRETADPPGGGVDPSGVQGGVTQQQAAARAKLLRLLDALTDLAGTLGPDRVFPAESYTPHAIAVLARPWTDPQDGLTQPERPWPGPALPGEPLAGFPGLGCVTTSGDRTAAVLEAARHATMTTPWVGAGGQRWSVTFRPLLPDETGCADLA